MYDQLHQINTRPESFSCYTAETLWNDKHISRKMLAMHLDEKVDPASRKMDFIEESVDWIAERFDLGPKTSISKQGPLLPWRTGTAKAGTANCAVK